MRAKDSTKRAVCGADIAMFVRGCNVVVNYAGSEAAAEAVAKEIEGTGVKAIAVKADTSDPDAVSLSCPREVDLGPELHIASSILLCLCCAALSVQRSQILAWRRDTNTRVERPKSDAFSRRFGEGTWVLVNGNVAAC
eukprot:2624763-Rhodomonas_salina.2